MAYIRSDRVNTVKIEELNRLVRTEPETLVQRGEERYDRLLSDVADALAGALPAHKVIMLSGASNAGKTTSSLKLCALLAERGVTSHTISLDNFFLPRERCPLDEEGKPDIESPRALDAELLCSAVESLIAGRETALPKYDFKTGRSIRGHSTLTVGEHEIVLIEGIHALNDTLLMGLPQDRLCRIYLAVRTNYEGEGFTLPKREVRLLRRLVRDHKFRGAGPEATFGMWEGVCRGEERYIKPFAKHADIILDSSFYYEPAVLRDFALPLLEQVPKGSEFYAAARQLREKLLPVESLPASLVPGSSLLREFIGGSQYYGEKK